MARLPPGKGAHRHHLSGDPVKQFILHDLPQGPLWGTCNAGIRMKTCAHVRADTCIHAFLACKFDVRPDLSLSRSLGTNLIFLCVTGSMNGFTRLPVAVGKGGGLKRERVEGKVEDSSRLMERCYVDK